MAPTEELRTRTGLGVKKCRDRQSLSYKEGFFRLLFKLLLLSLQAFTLRLLFFFALKENLYGSSKNKDITFLAFRITEKLCHITILTGIGNEFLQVAIMKQC